jgi:hypothetical protein
MKIYKGVQKLLVGGAHRQTADLISLLSFVESRLIIQTEIYIEYMKFTLIK